GLCYKYLQDKESAEDAVCDIFEQLHQKLLQHEVENFRSWIYTTSRNHCLMLLRKQKSHRWQELDRDVEDTGLHSLQIKQWIDQKLDMLEEALQHLNTDQRNCVAEFYLKGKSYKLIAKEQDMSLGKVKSHIQNGKRNLKIILEQHEEFDHG
ncbi:MAG: sigma-70 family RNA polymerase sigma factor, partial [Flavobacteriales bacterium]|nr:sigma-70 family RNA polymerase sigma factor [Flavobacteriales bacterium]